MRPINLIFGDLVKIFFGGLLEKEVLSGEVYSPLVLLFFLKKYFGNKKVDSLDAGVESD